jgi:hypothetical protein
MATNTEPSGFGAFFQKYTKTWMHAVATAGLTAFGLLSFVHRGFVVLALACYVVPPIVLYLTRGDSADESVSPTDAALADAGDSERIEREPSERKFEPEPTAETTTAGTESKPATTPESEAETTEPERESPSATEPDAASGRGREAEPATERESTVDREPATGAEPSSEPADTGAESEDVTAESDADDVPETVDNEPETADAEPRWRSVDAPTDAALLDVAVANSSAVAAGENGTVLERGPDDDWKTVLEDGPAAQGQTLHGADVTDDGTVVWVAGDGGAVGRLEIGSGRHTDYSAPDGQTDNLAGLAVAGTNGDETVLLLNGSGAVTRGRYRDGDLAWSEPVKPGSGSSLSDAALVDAETGYCCDTNDGVFETDDGGRTFETVGLEGADGTPVGIAAAGRGDCHVCTDDGVVHRYDGSTWTPERVADAALSGISRCEDRLAICTPDGAVYERDGATAEWERADIGSSEGLEAISIGADLGVAVGGDGTVIERR